MALDLERAEAHVSLKERRLRALSAARRISQRFRAQAIVRPSTLEVTGIEILSRNRLLFCSYPTMLREDIAALKAAARMARTGFYREVHCNVEILSLLSPDWLEVMGQTMTRGIVIEIVERNDMLMHGMWLERVIHVLSLIRIFGGKIAMDDVAYTDQSIHLIEMMRPEIVKVEDARYAPVLRQHGDMEIIVERIETAQLAQEAVNLGVDYLQGYWCDVQVEKCVPSSLTPPGIEARTKGDWNKPKQPWAEVKELLGVD